MKKSGKPFHSTEYWRDAGDSYFQWLADDLALHNGNEYWRLLRALHRKEFYFSLKADSPLSEDGLYLRYMYKRNYRDYEDNNPVLPSCLEVLLSLAMRLAAGLVDYDERDWFWIFMHNLSLDRFYDDDFDELGGTDKVNYILSVWLTRKFKHDGMKYNIFKFTSDCDVHQIDMLHQGYMYIRQNFGPNHVFDMDNYQVY